MTRDFYFASPSLEDYQMFLILTDVIGQPCPADLSVACLTELQAGVFKILVPEILI